MEDLVGTIFQWRKGWIAPSSCQAMEALFSNALELSES